ncbi:Argininosuccinate lyase [Candidatus Burarchaeum australiense]|nr:Argininosuccinate lyase [Candidatus Burarchaeum australiense]
MAVSPLDSRYATDMNAIFDEERKLRYWLEVEVALAQAHAEVGDMPRECAREIEAAARKVKLERVRSIEDEIHHDLMAMVRALSEQCSPKSARYVHLGATSYDIEDTATALMLRDAYALIEQRCGKLSSVLGKLALAHAKTVCVGRTHGQHAVPTTYGMKFALWKNELDRHLVRLAQSKPRVFVGKVSGAVGTMAALGPDAFRIEGLMMKNLRLEAARVTNQVVQRDRHAEALFILALMAGTLEKMAKEIRNLQRSEIGEVAEPFGKKQVGSSAMPQKRNPHKSERVCSLARIVRSDVQVALENIALEHERDLTNSANERIIIPQSFILTDYMMKEMTAIMEGLVFFPENIRKNLEMSGGAILSERLVGALVEKGMPRQEAHELVRGLAMEAFAGRTGMRDVAAKDRRVARLLDKKALGELFDFTTYVGQAEKIIGRSV